MLSGLWWARHQILRTLARLLKFPFGYGQVLAEKNARTARQQRELRTRKLLLGHTIRAGQQQAQQPASKLPRQADVRSPVGCSRRAVLLSCPAAHNRLRVDARTRRHDPGWRPMG